MTCGKLHIQSRGILWVLSTVYLMRVVYPMFGSTKHSTSAAFNLVIQRSRIAGGILTIPVDSTVRLVKCSGREAAHNTIRLRYGPSRKTLIMRASNSLEREKWLVGIIAAIGASHGSSGMEYEPISSTSRTLSENSSDISYTNSTDENSHYLVTSSIEPQTPPSAVKIGIPAAPKDFQSHFSEERGTLPEHHDTVFLPLPATVDGQNIASIDIHSPPSPQARYHVNTTCDQPCSSYSAAAPTYHHISLWRRVRQQLAVATQVLSAFSQGIV